MVPPNTDIVLQNRRISQSETRTINICDVVNAMARACSMRGLAEIKCNVVSILAVIARLPRHLDISQRTNCPLMPTNYFVVVLLSRQIKRVVRLTACNYERCVFVTIFSGRKIRLQTIPLDKRTAQPIASIQPSKHVFEVNLHTICRPN